MALIVNNLILRYSALNEHGEIINMSKNDQLLLLLCIEIFWLPLICQIYKMCTIVHILSFTIKRVERPSKFPENKYFVSSLSVFGDPTLALEQKIRVVTILKAGYCIEVF